ncbi:glycoside hydrolase family 88 protein [Afifella pfennigii]|uniref:glycoside hydrolase family 88 protein n=1 Tax=Afifella pfennigii TaxID=209897 RepID=UPI00047D67AA|nr:glycoside hydrolase family 88 protein [Afifella pfennigii]
MSDIVLTPQLVAAVADRLRDHAFQTWFYGDSIGFEGLIAASDLTGNPTWFDFSHGFFRAWASRRQPWQPDDNTAPGHAMCTVIERTGDALLREAVIDLARHLRARRRVGAVSITFEDTLRSLRMPYGGVKLSAEEEAQMRDPGPGIWLDCMHFDPPFFAHLERIDPGAGWSEVAVAEILAYRDLLVDAGTGLYQHFWLERTGRAYTRGWGRGQGWALLGLIDVAEHLSATQRGAEEVRAETLRLARLMLDWQLDDGNWWSLVHEPKSGPESSTAAFMACAFFRGMSLGLLPQSEFAEPAERAYRAMEANLDANGNLLGVSAAVYSALVEEHYWHVPLDRIVPWGQGPALTAAAARKAFLATTHD